MPALPDKTIPVFSRPILKPALSMVLASPTAGSSPRRPAGLDVRPMLMQPRRNVPVVRTTESENILLPSSAGKWKQIIIILSMKEKLLLNADWIHRKCNEGICHTLKVLKASVKKLAQESVALAAKKRSQSLCQKCRWQDTAKHTSPYICGFK